MATEILPGAEGTLKTVELQAKIELELGLVVHARTIRSWVERPDNPLPVAYRGKNGQSHRFRWLDFLLWYESDQERLSAAADSGDDPESVDLDRLDWHSARTISARERAKRDILETRKLEGKYGDIQTFDQAAEDFARQAVNRFRAIPSRIAPALVGKDELEIDRLIDAEIRAACQEMEQSARSALAAIDAEATENTEKNNHESIDI